MKNIAVLVLAAGKSSRMNSIKQLEKVNHKTLLEHTLEKTQRIYASTIFCVLGANADKIKSEVSTRNVQFIENTNFEDGLSSSIVSGIQHFKQNNFNFEAIFILLADQPAIDVAYIEDMLHLFEQHKDKIIASNYGEKLGVPVIFPKKYFSDIFLIKGDKGAKEFINKKKNEIICSTIPTNFLDIDTREDLQRYKNSILK
ncbi:NTP transferase domain-containing protein [Polaribacter sp. AHE13PA]|uniref:nucleotidyltransferase family protein n=1 Tax=Polaribacter sp. AHE13PA TaxID=2745562 RepID=UPI001C4F51C2|nr:nucleotidyltransferase family protein [Polaribacter sp. AHE13PA]QXP65806.1 nucleotidyltransferase family protein [Polaribacter sp. AHE13PA]